MGTPPSPVNPVNPVNLPSCRVRFAVLCSRGSQGNRVLRLVKNPSLKAK